ncbi:MAG: hypothetical protein OXG98_00100 [Gemmatimonadetes bacterium]|nr:hypothetical protein [Gemmatimonadota bacterium]
MLFDGKNTSLDQFESAVNRVEPEVNRVKSAIDRIEPAVNGLHTLKEQTHGKYHRSDETADHDPVFAFHGIKPDPIA